MGIFQDDWDWMCTFIEFTTTPAQYDARHDSYFTYLKVPYHVPWNPENHHGVSPTSTAVNITDVSPEWIPALANHYGIQIEAEKE